MVSAIKDAIKRAVSRMTATESRSVWTELLGGTCPDRENWNIQVLMTTHNMAMLQQKI